MRDKLSLAIAEPQPIPVGKIILNLFKNPTFMLSTLCITNVMFVLIGLQFWAVQYATVVLKADANFVYLSFSGTVITAPCLGAVVGGAVTTKFLGSYKNPKALVLCFIVYLLFTACCIPCPFINNYIVFIIILWMAIFF